jgi:rubrerythrin
MSMMENLGYIKERGMNEFLEKEEKKWRCPECGGVISCHNGICYTCGLDKLKAKRRKYRWEDEQ